MQPYRQDYYQQYMTPEERCVRGCFELVTLPGRMISGVIGCAVQIATLPWQIATFPFKVMAVALNTVESSVNTPVYPRPVHATRYHPPVATIYDPSQEISGDDALLRAVKGIKNEVAVVTGVVNPLLGLMVGAATFPERPHDLHNIDRLLDQGANINHREISSGYTPLIYAAYYGYPNIARHLVLKGANVELKEKEGYNAYTMAQYYVNRYTKSLTRNDQKVLDKNFSAEQKQQMHDFYVKQISNYQQVVNLLERYTLDRTMPRSFF